VGGLQDVLGLARRFPEAAMLYAIKFHNSSSEVSTITDKPVAIECDFHYRFI
jgi:hypothetical protein